MTSRHPIRLLIIDDHAVIRAGLRMLLESRGDLQVVAEAADGEKACRLAAQHQPDILLLDLDLGPESGLNLLPALFQAAPQARVIILTGIRDTEAHQQAVSLGALGVVAKEEAAEVLLTAIEKVGRGEAWLDPSLVAQTLNRMRRVRSAENREVDKLASLSKREKEIVLLVAEGLRNKEIGRRLFISEKTVRHHLTSIFNKLDVSDRLELVVYAFRQGLQGLAR